MVLLGRGQDSDVLLGGRTSPVPGTSRSCSSGGVWHRASGVVGTEKDSRIYVTRKRRRVTVERGTFILQTEFSKSRIFFK